MAYIVDNILPIITIILVIINAFISYHNNQKSRRILVDLDYKLKMSNALFEHIIKVLDIGRKTVEEDDITERNQMKHDILSHKIFIWTNLNLENKYSSDMREHCNKYITFCAGLLENSTKQQDPASLLSINKSAQHIWVLIDKYIEEEAKLRERLV